MDPIKQFYTEQEKRIKSYAHDNSFVELSKNWRAQSMKKEYVYNFDWLGRPIIQYPQDIQAIQEIIWETKPDLIIETGIAHGGSLILSASMLALLDISDFIQNESRPDPRASKRKVIGIDLEIRQHNRIEIEKHPMSNWITMIEGSSTDNSIVETVTKLSKNYQKVMVCLDSMHTHEHVLAELEAYANLVTKGCYCVVFDTFIEDVERGFFSDRPWNVANNPKTAVHEWLKLNCDFEIDKMRHNKLQITAAPDGFLKRTGSTNYS